MQVACLSQIRQIGQGLIMYDSENKKLPYQLVEVNAAGKSVALWGGVKNYTWMSEVSQILGTEATTPPGNNGWFQSNPTLRCPCSRLIRWISGGRRSASPIKPIRA